MLFIVVVLLGIHFSMQIQQPQDAIVTIKAYASTYKVVFEDTQIVYLAEDNVQKSYKLPDNKMILDWVIGKRTMEVAPSIIAILRDSEQNHGNELVVLDMTFSGELVLSSSRSMKGMNPWQLKLGDVNGDGHCEIGVTVFKETRFHPVMANRPYLYTWTEDGIAPFWRGSRLAHPFTEYLYEDLTGDGIDNLLSIECLEDGRQFINSYAWKGFGFESIGQSEIFDRLDHLEKTGHDCVKVKWKDQVKYLRWDHNGSILLDD